MKKHNKVKFSLYIANDDWVSKLECDKGTLCLSVCNVPSDFFRRGSFLSLTNFMISAIMNTVNNDVAIIRW
ncbi:MAG: hypothetical protein K0Q53_1764 [Massilibacillus sp.]|jgi:hypothetical protein|nr:hypothetical protein [Massilibacillus sp.]